MVSPSDIWTVGRGSTPGMLSSTENRKKIVGYFLFILKTVNTYQSIKLGTKSFGSVELFPISIFLILEDL